MTHINHHALAWDSIKPMLFGDVIEVVRKKPWGFKEDDARICTVDVQEFLAEPMPCGTIILHILSGEGEPKTNVELCLKKAHVDAVQVLVLEHDPVETGVRELHYMTALMPNSSGAVAVGRNLLYQYNTFEMLELPPLSNAVVAAGLADTWVTAADDGIDKERLVYTHTSESRIDFEIPPGRVFWVIGGGLAYESMQSKNTNFLFDNSLRQVLYCASIYGEDSDKLSRIWSDVGEVHVGEDYKHWRVTKPNGVAPDRIMWGSTSGLYTTDSTIYVSTVPEEAWERLAKHNNIIEAVSQPRDVPKLRMYK